MRPILISMTLCLALVAGAASAGPADEVVLLAGGGTPVTNGIFIPPATCDNYGCTGVPLQVPQGANVRFVNLDAAVLTNVHQIRSLKSRRNGRPLFQSQAVAGPGETTMITSHLKPGTYPYLCTTHYGMYGIIEVTAS